MTQPWWPGAGEPPASAASTNPAPWMPPPPQGQNRQQGQNHPQHPPSSAPAPTTQIGVPLGQPATPVNTVAGGPNVPGGQVPRPPTVSGLGFVNVLLVLGALAFAAFVARGWVVDWATAIDPCLDSGGAWECVVNDASRTQVLAPLLAVVAALSLARGAGVERRQGRGIGYLYALLGFGVIGLAWSMGAGL